MRGQCVITAFFTVFLAGRRQRCALHRCSLALRACTFFARGREFLGISMARRTSSVVVEVGPLGAVSATLRAADARREVRKRRGKNKKRVHRLPNAVSRINIISGPTKRMRISRCERDTRFIRSYKSRAHSRVKDIIF